MENVNNIEYKGKKYIYSIGTIYGLRKVIDFFNKNDRLYAKTVCIKCGKISTIRASDLYNSKTNRCTCITKKYNHLNKRLYSIYFSMKYRCYNPNCDAYKNYGGRGIKICKEWLDDFMSFYSWAMANGYENNLTIDRIDNNGDYEPNNCRWITKSKNTAIANSERPKNLKKVICLETSKVYNSIKEANIENRTSKVGEVCNGHRKTAGGKHWKFYKEENNEEI